MPILGIDEVGRGPWAGPLVVGAVILGSPSDPIWQPLTDSKKLTAKKRTTLNQLILTHATATGLGWVPAPELDSIGLSAALRLASQRALQAVLQSLNSSSPTSAVPKIIIDGTINFLSDTPFAPQVSTLKKADLLVKEVSAASIIAKVARDNYMIKLAQKYPHYGFEQHVGYGTAAHRTALDQYGLTPEHRRSFKPIQRYLPLSDPINPPSDPTNPPSNPTSSTPNSPSGNPTPPTLSTPANHPSTPPLANTPKIPSTTLGHQAETIVLRHLKSLGHTILARNYCTRFYEIDLISATSEHLYFTEVKYRHSSTHGTPLATITSAKQRQMAFAAQSFLQQLSRRLHRPLSSLPSPILAAAAVSGPDFHLDTWLPII